MAGSRNGSVSGTAPPGFDCGVTRTVNAAFEPGAPSGPLGSRHTPTSAVSPGATGTLATLVSPVKPGGTVSNERSNTSSVAPPL